MCSLKMSNYFYGNSIKDCEFLSSASNQAHTHPTEEQIPLGCLTAWCRPGKGTTRHCYKRGGACKLHYKVTNDRACTE